MVRVAPPNEDRPVEPSPVSARFGEPWGTRLWLSLAATILIAFCLESYGISSWPMADDEVPSLVELGMLHIGAEKFFSVPADQIARLPMANPVWYNVQRLALAMMPASELGYRMPSVFWGLCTSALVFVLAARWRGVWFAGGLAIVLHGNQLFILLQQINRFYSLPLLLFVATLGAMWRPAGRAATLVVTPALTALTVLSHNVTAAAFVLGFCAAVPAYWLGAVPRSLVLRTGIAAAVSLGLYVGYVRPLVAGWHSTGNPTPVLVSFAAYAGIPALALALLGVWLSATGGPERRPMQWWSLLFVGTLCFLQITTASMTWNPRYFLFFLPPVWMLAADATEYVAGRLGRGWTGAVWYGCVAALFLPSLLSHYADGSRHDYRQAASVLIAHATPGDVILSDDAETISYYLPEGLRRSLEVRTRVTTFPASAFFAVYRSNAWMPLPRIPNRQMELLGEVSRRRLDQFSHVLRIYRVAPSQLP